MNAQVTQETDVTQGRKASGQGCKTFKVVNQQPDIQEEHPSSGLDLFWTLKLTEVLGEINSLPAAKPESAWWGEGWARRVAAAASGGR